jgi:transcriptional regulator with XRE-family HTH domain
VADGIQERLGGVIKRRRLAADLSQEALAHAAGLHFTTVSLVERGKRAPTVVVVQKLAAALGTSMTALFAEAEGLAPPADPHPPRRRKK